MLEVILYSVISSIVILGLLFFILQFGVKYLSKKKAGGISEQVDGINSKISEIDNAIVKALEKFEPFISSSELESIDQAKEKLEFEAVAIEKKLAQIETALTAKQLAVSEAENSHNDLKRAKEASAILADELKTNKEILASELATLENELTQSLSQLEHLSSGLNLTPHQETGMNKIKNALTNSRTQLNTLAQTYKQSSLRFVNLQAQYADLEKEFTKLVEKELTG